MNNTAMYSTLARYYDRMHHFIGYRGQVDFISGRFAEFNNSGGKDALDVACGTGNHANYLAKLGFLVTGIDKSKDMLAQARLKNESVRFMLGDMRDFNLDKEFDLITCMFNSIMYCMNGKELLGTLRNFREHLKRGGILYFEAFDKIAGIENMDASYELNEGGLKISSLYRTRYDKERDILIYDNTFVINGKEYRDYHEAGAFSHQDYLDALKEAGFEILLAERVSNAFSHTYIARKN